jgi:hypothetical protein
VGDQVDPLIALRAEELRSQETEVRMAAAYRPAQTLAAFADKGRVCELSPLSFVRSGVPEK